MKLDLGNRTERPLIRTLIVNIPWVLIALIVLSLTNIAWAQRTTGTLRGQVLDPSGASVPGAQVTVTNNATGVSKTITTTSAGTYNVPSLLPGNYTVAVEAKGFQG